MISPGKTAAVCALLLCAPAWGQGAMDRTLVLGQSAALSGPRAAAGETIRNGALAYLRRLNAAGGVNGRRVELATFDDRGEPARALENTRRLVDEFGVFALFGYPETSLTRDVLGLVRRSRAIMFGAQCGAAAPPAGRQVYSVCPDQAGELEQLVDDYAHLGQRRFALVRSDDAAGEALAAAAHAALSRRGLGGPRDVPAGAGPAAAAVQAVLSAAPDVAILAMPQPPAADLVRELRRGGSRALLVATSLADPAAMARALGPAGAGLVLSQVVPPLAQISLPVISDFRADYAAETGSNDYSPAALESYLAAKALVEAMRRAGPVPTRAALAQALEAMGNYDAGGYVVHFSSTERQGSARVYLQSLDRDGKLLH